MICIWWDWHYEALRVTTRLHLTGREALSDTERERLALTARNAGLGIPHPLQLPFISSQPAHQWQLPSGAHTTTEHQLPCWCTLETGTGKGRNSHQHRSDATTEEMALKPKLSKDQQCAKGQANEKGPCHGWPPSLQRSTTSASISRRSGTLLSQDSLPQIQSAVVSVALFTWTLWTGLACSHERLIRFWNRFILL